MNIVPFQFGENSVRVIADDNGETWFVASDVASVLEYRDAYNATRSLDDDEKGTQIVSTPSGEQQMLVINESGLYSAILRSRKAEAKRFKKWVTSEVLPTIRRTGRYEAPQAPVYATSPAVQAVQLADVIATALRVSNSGRLSMVRQAVGMHDPANLPLVPVYAIDAPSDSVAGSSEPTHSASHLLRKHGTTLSAQAFNRLAEAAGYLETLTRQGSRGQEKQFKSVTQEGLRYGKNVSNPQSPRETQPHWYDSRFEELMTELGIIGS